ncbi:MAG: carboxypeptidase-like regulatory domain-containing protein, partial [Planctomycetota bacterium]
TEIAPGDAATTAASSVTLRGRVVDTSGLPVEDARASLERRKPWIEGMAELRPGAFGYGARADAAGAFSIEFPLTEGIGGTIDVRGGEFRTLYRESLSYDELTAAAAAEGALGDVVLQPAGSLEGRVIDDTGRPVPGAVLATGPSLSSSYGLQPNTETLSREDGVFVLGHVPLGEIGIKVEARGHASLHLPAVAIERGRRVALGDVVLDVLPTPWLRGRVVDHQGIGVPRQWIFAGPTSRTGRSVTGRTDDDGRFDLDLVTAGPHKLKVERRDFLTVGGLGDPGPVFEPGSEAIEIRLERLPTTTFLVVDGVTGEPVRRFGLSVGLRRGSKAERRIHGTGGGGRIRDYPDGRLEAGARPGVDLVEVTAPGFRAFRGDVEHDGSAEAIQTIRLDRGATVRGIVLRGGQPVPGVRCWLAARRYDRRDGPKETVTDSEGGYTLRGLPSGTIEIVAGADDGSSSGRIQVTTHAGETVSALPIDLVGPGAIAGHVVVPDGVALEGLSVHLDDWQDDRRGAVSATGTFRFEDVEPGRHTVTLVGRPGELASSAKVRVEVEPGQTSKVRVNATSCGLCRVALTIATPGVDPRTVSVEILHGGVVGTEREGIGPARSTLRKVRFLDADGRIEFTEPATGVALVDLTFGDHGRFVLPEPRLHLTAFGEIEESIVIQPARLDVRLPDDLVLPEDACLRLWLEHEHLIRPVASRFLSFREGRFDAAGTGGGPAWADRTVFIDHAPPGRYVARLTVRSQSAIARRIELADGSYAYESEGQHDFSRAVVLEPGATLRIQLEAGDRL